MSGRDLYRLKYYILLVEIRLLGFILPRPGYGGISKHVDRSEGFPARDILFLGTLEQGSARCPELLGRRRRRQLEIKVNIQARKLLLMVFLRFWGRGERYTRMETGVPHRISLRVS